MRRSFKILGTLAIFGALVVPALAGNTILFSSKQGDITFPFTAPLKNGTAGAIDNMIIGATTPRAATFTTVSSSGQSCTATPCTIQGIGAAQGGSVHVNGGTSSTSANAGGNSRLIGGAPGATGAGGIASIAGGAGGATSGAGGAASVTGGAGTAGNSTGGIASLVGGAGQGTAAGAAANVTGGASGAGATGDGAAANVSGGAALSTNGNGGSVVLTGGAKAGSGIAGGVRVENILVQQVSAPTAKTTSSTLTAAQVLTGIITVTQGSGANSAQQMPTGTDLQAALPVDFAVGDSFDFSIINLGGASETATLTVNTDVTIVGRAIVDVAAATASGSGRFRVRKTADHVFVVYRLS